MEWVIPEDSKPALLAEFKMFDKDTGRIPGLEVAQMLMGSGLDQSVLSRVWDLSDVDKDGFLNENEYFICKLLVIACQNQVPLPDSLPQSLLDSAGIKNAPVANDDTSSSGSGGPPPAFRILFEGGQTKSITYGDKISLAESIKQAAGVPTLDGLIVTGNGTVINPNITLGDFVSRFESCFEVVVKKGSSPGLVENPFNSVTLADFVAYKAQYDALNPAEIPSGFSPASPAHPQSQGWVSRTASNAGPALHLSKPPGCAALFGQTGLPQEDLALAWGLADLRGTGNFDLLEFCVAGHLIAKRLQSQGALTIPTSLPPTLIPSIKGHIQSGGSAPATAALVHYPVAERVTYLNSTVSPMPKPTGEHKRPTAIKTDLTAYQFAAMKDPSHDLPKAPKHKSSRQTLVAQYGVAEAVSNPYTNLQADIAALNPTSDFASLSTSIDAELAQIAAEIEKQTALSKTLKERLELTQTELNTLTTQNNQKLALMTESYSQIVALEKGVQILADELQVLATELEHVSAPDLNKIENEIYQVNNERLEVKSSFDIKANEFTVVATAISKVKTYGLSALSQFDPAILEPPTPSTGQPKAQPKESSHDPKDKKDSKKGKDAKDKEAKGGKAAKGPKDGKEPKDHKADKHEKPADEPLRKAASSRASVFSPRNLFGKKKPEDEKPIKEEKKEEKKGEKKDTKNKKPEKTPEVQFPAKEADPNALEFIEDPQVKKGKSKSGKAKDTGKK